MQINMYWWMHLNFQEKCSSSTRLYVGAYIQKKHRGKILYVVEYIWTILGHMV